ncbi:prolyl oligopeptidase family serine peptidase [Tomitella cavernea]|uniref:Prolyl oligopeptidase family serine peptidase n=1 Tax=Tomitella cavernea TaxID=1387982 RepID=A0ABP9CEF8_9ACTN
MVARDLTARFRGRASHTRATAGRGRSFAAASAAFVAVGALTLAPTVSAAPAPAPAAAQAGALAQLAPGTLLSSPVEIDPSAAGGALWIPGAARAWKLEYRTSTSGDGPAASTGTVYVPEGQAPEGGWPVVSWAHGTTGLGDSCAPSDTGWSQRDLDYLAHWMGQGYAVVATDYAGLGTPGGMPYLDGKVEAHNVVDMVKAGRNVAGADLSREWVVIGQSQGGGAAITTARYADEYGGPDLDYRGAVGTGVPAYIENIVAIAGPGMPPIALPKGMTAYGLYILAGLDTAHPELGIPSVLTEQGRALLGQAKVQCLGDFEETAVGTVLGSLFTAPLSSLPDFHRVLFDYMKMPEDGFGQPFFIGQGLKDTDIIMPSTLIYAETLRRNGQPLTFRTYPTDHSGTMAASLPDSTPFVRALFDGNPPAPSFGSAE